MVAGVCLRLWAIILPAFMARRFVETEETTAATSCGGLPSFGHISGNQCGNALWGTLVVGCVSAFDLKKVDWFSESDPFCRVRISDRAAVETRGFWNRYGKYKPKSDDFRSAIKNDEPDPVWQEAFTFNFLCPQMPQNGHRYQVEVTLKDSGVTKNEFLGVVYEPIEKLISGEVAGEVTYDLSDVQRADSSDSRTAKGRVKLFFKWCAPGDRDCVHSAMTGAGLSSRNTQDIDCEMSCAKALHDAAIDAVKGVAHSIDRALQAERLHEHYEDMEDHWDSVGDHLEHGHNRQAEDHADRMEDHYDDLEDHYQDQADEYWAHARRQMSRLPDELRHITASTCGSRASESIAQAAMGYSRLFPKKFKKRIADNAKYRGVRDIERKVNEKLACMKQQWKQGYLLTNLGEAQRGCYN